MNAEILFQTIHRCLSAVIGGSTDSPSKIRPVLTFCFASLLTGGCFLAFTFLCWEFGLDWIPRHVPPLYAAFQPLIVHPVILVPVAYIVGALCYLVWREWNNPFASERKLKVCFFVIAFLFVGCVAFLSNDTEALENPYGKPDEYFHAIPANLGLVGFLKEYTQLQPNLPLHARTHPPGPILVLWGLTAVLGRRVMLVSLGSLALSCLAVVPLFNLTLLLYGRRTAVAACSLYALMPGFEFFAATSVDGFFALFLLSALLMFVENLGRDHPAKMFLSGLLWAVTVLQSFNLCIMGLFLGVYFFLVCRLEKTDSRVLVKDGAWALAGFCGLFAGLYLATGFNIFSCFLRAWEANLDVMRDWETSGRRPAGLKWLIGNPVAFFYFAGFPVVYLFIRQVLIEIRRAVPLAKADLFALSALSTMLVFNFIFLSRGEAERICMFFYPFLAILAAKRLVVTSGDHWVPLAALMFMAVQTVVMECMLLTYW